MQHSFVLTDRSNLEILAGAKQLAAQERNTSAHLIAHLAEIHARRLYLDEGFSCLSKYCMGALGLSEEASYRRADAALLARSYPIILDMLAEGSIHLTTLRIIGGCLSAQNHKEVLEAARHKSKQQLELLKATLFPQPDVPPMLRKLPGPAAEEAEPTNGLFPPAGEAESLAMAPVEAKRHPPDEVASPLTMAAFTPPVSRSTVPARKMAPLAPERYKLQLTLDEETYQALRQLQDLLRHQVPDGDLVQIIKDAVLERLQRVKREKFCYQRRSPRKTEQATLLPNAEPPVSSGPTSDPQMNSRHIPAAVKRAVWDRDKGQCAYVSRSGRRCAERGRLEFHHVHAYALGGLPTVENIALRCRAHNAHEGAQQFGEKRRKSTGAGASQ